MDVGRETVCNQQKMSQQIRLEKVELRNLEGGVG